MANLRDQLAKWNGPAPGDRRILPVSAKSEGTSRTDSPKGIETAVYFEIKTRLHQQLLSRLNLREVESIPPDRLKDHLKIAAIDLIEEEALPLNEVEHDRLVRDLQNEILGLGPLEPLLADPSVSEIMVNGPRRVFIERRGRVELTDIQFDDDAHLLKIIDRIVSRVGRRIDEASPMADARLPDGSRVNAIIAPLALDGPSVTIRRFATVPLKIEDLIAKEAMTPAMAQLLSGFVKAKANIIVAGGTGSGKTTLLNLIGGVDQPTSGDLVVGDTNIARLGGDALARWRAASIGYIFQLYNLMPVLTAVENVELPLLLVPMSAAERRRRAETALQLVGLGDRLRHYPRQLSGGQEQRVAIARALVSDPKVLLADEPTGDLDRKSAEEVLKLLERLNREFGKTIVMVTHDPHAAERATRQYHLEKGVLTN